MAQPYTLASDIDKIRTMVLVLDSIPNEQIFNWLQNNL